MKQKLTKVQIQHLKLLAKQNGPMTFTGLHLQDKTIRQHTMHTLVSRKLARIRCTIGRTDRLEILSAGRKLLTN